MLTYIDMTAAGLPHFKRPTSAVRMRRRNSQSDYLNDVKRTRLSLNCAACILRRWRLTMLETVVQS